MLLFAANLCKRFFSRSIKPVKAKAAPKAGTALKDRVNKPEETVEEPPAKRPRTRKTQETPEESSAEKPKAATKPKPKRKAQK